VTHVSDPSFLVLHALRLKGFAEDHALAESAGLDVADVSPRLSSFADEGHVLRREGRISGWALTPAGRQRHTDLVTADVDAAGTRDAVDDAYRRFYALNADLLAVCTAWQIRDVDGEQKVNDHTDATYDKEVVERLLGVHDRVRPVCADLRDAMERFGRYGSRLRAALERLVDGETDWFTKPTIPSYHTVWFELHEDLLVSLGIERSAEAHA
jgi:hypothetical protein